MQFHVIICDLRANTSVSFIVSFIVIDESLHVCEQKVNLVALYVMKFASFLL